MTGPPTRISGSGSGTAFIYLKPEKGNPLGLSLPFGPSEEVPPPPTHRLQTTELIVQTDRIAKNLISLEKKENYLLKPLHAQFFLIKTA